MKHEFSNQNIRIELINIIFKKIWEKRGIKALPAEAIHLKPAVKLIGLGSIGHNTQIIAPQYAARVRWIAELIDTELNPDNLSTVISLHSRLFAKKVPLRGCLPM